MSGRLWCFHRGFRSRIRALSRRHVRPLLARALNVPPSFFLDRPEVKFATITAELPAGADVAFGV